MLSELAIPLVEHQLREVAHRLRGVDHQLCYSVVHPQAYTEFVQLSDRLGPPLAKALFSSSELFGSALEVQSG